MECNTHGENEKCLKNGVNFAGKKPLGRPKRRWLSTIKFHLTIIILEGIDWIHVARIPKKMGNLLTS
jgi:hypothetical protein